MSYDTAYEEFKENGYELLEKQYKNMSTKMIARDKDGYMYYSNLATLRKGSKFDKFNKNNPYTIENMKLFLKLNNKKSSLVSEEYKGAKNKYIFICKCGKKYETLFSSVFNGEKDSCNICSIQISTEKSRYDYKHIYNEFKNVGLELLESEYKNNSVKMKCADSEGYLYKTTYANIRSGATPSRFGNGNDYTIENIQNLLNINQTNTTVLTKKYNGNQGELHLKCGMCNGEFKTMFSSVLSKKKYYCNSCSMEIAKTKMRLSYDEVFKYVEENSDCKLLSKKYIGNNKKLKFECNCGGVFHTTFAGFKCGKMRCDICSNILKGNNKRLDISDIKRDIVSRGYIPMFDTYEGIENKLPAKTKDGYLVDIIYSHFQNGKEPEIFHPTNKFTIDNINNFCKIETDGEYRCLDLEYVDNTEKMQFVHNTCGTKFTASWVNFQGRISKSGVKQVGTRCPFCQINKTESTHATVLKQLFLKLKDCGVVLEDQSCVNPSTGYPLPTDIVSHNDKIAIEIQSSYHDTESQKQKDEIKKEYWINRGYSFYDPDIRDYTILDLAKLFFPDIKKIPKWINYNFSNKLDVVEAQRLLDSGMTMNDVASCMNVKKSTINGAVFSKRLVLPSSYMELVKNEKMVVQLDMNGKYLNTFKNASVAARHLGLSSSSALLKRVNNQRLKGGSVYHNSIWVFEADYLSGEYDVTDKHFSRYAYSVVQLSLCGKFINKYDDMYLAEESTGLRRGDIAGNAHGRRQTCGGFVWVLSSNYKEGKYNLPESKQLDFKKVMRINPKNKQDFLIYNNSKDVAKEFGLPNWEVRSWIRDDRYARRGYVWIYKEDYEEYLKQH